MTKVKKTATETIENQAAADFAKFSKTLENKKYALPLKKETVADLLEYFKNEITWKFHESVGVEKAYDLLKEAQATYNGSEIMLDALTIQALYVFLSRKEGKGYDEAKKFHHDIMRPFSAAIQRVKADEATKQELEHKKLAAEQGLNTAEDAPETMTAEDKAAE